MPKFLRRFLCMFGKHGKIIGGFDLIKYDIGTELTARKLRYRSFVKCSVCDYEVADRRVHLGFRNPERRVHRMTKEELNVLYGKFGG